MDGAMADGVTGIAAVMFTDVVGSTELRLRIGEDAAELVRARHDAVLLETIGAGHGHVVKHLGDGVMATFRSCSDALSTGVAIQQAVDLANRRGDHEPLSVRIGIAVGDVTFDGDDCFGLCVVQAQRLEAAASPGTIRCTDVVAQLAQGRGDHELRSLGDLQLKGLPDPIAVSEVLWAPLREVSERDDRLPPVLAGGGLPFAGRRDVFSRLTEAWTRVAAGGFEMVVLAGEPGVGKTRLAQELARWALDQGGVVLGGRCDEDAGVPFQPLGMALEWFVRHDPVGGSELGEYPGDLVRIVPGLGDIVAGLPARLDDEPDAERRRLSRAVLSWLTAGAAERPRLLVIDDLHWADESTLLLVRQLASLHPAGVMIIGTHRDTDVDRDHPLEEMLAGANGVAERIPLVGLGAEGLRELLVRAAGHDLDSNGVRFARRVQQATSGNPLFVGELLRDLIESGALVERDGQWTSDLLVEEAGIPDGVREVVGQRLRRLGAAERVLRSAAVIGHEFRVDVLADVVETTPDATLDALDAAAAAQLLVEVGVDRYRFAHALVRETLHAELSSSRRSREHRKVALALEARHADTIDEVVPELATHWIEASVGADRARAIEFAIRAGELAGERGAYESGARWFERALAMIDESTPTSPRWSEPARRVRVQLAEAEAVSGNAVEARRHSLEAARAAIVADDPVTVVAALRVRARHSFSAIDPDDPERVEVLRAALSMGSLDTWQRAALLGELAKELIFRRDIDGRRRALEAQDVLIDQLPLAERVQLVATAGATSYVCAPRRVLELRCDEAEAVLDGEESLSGSQRWRILGHLAYTALHLGDRHRFDRAVDGMQALRDRTGAVRDSMTLLHETMRSTIDGRLVEAQGSADELVDGLERLGVPEALSYRWTTTLAISRERDALDGLRPVLDGLERGGHPAGPERATAALVRLLRGDLDGVRGALRDLDSEEFADDATMQLCIAYWAEIVAGLRSERHCVDFIDRLSETSGVNLLIGGLYLGPVDRLLGLLHHAVGAHERADLLFSAAVEQQTALRSPAWVARTRLDWAAALLERRERQRATEMLAAAAAAMADLDLAESRRRHGELVGQLELIS